MVRKLLSAVIVTAYLACIVPFYADAAVHTLSEFKKLYPTFYILPPDAQYLKEKPAGCFLEGNIESKFNDHKDNKYLFETFNRLKNHLREKGFILVDSPQKADAILAFRIQLAGYDVYHECARNASVRLIDPVSNDTIMILYTPGFEFMTLKRDVYDELKALFKVIDANIDQPAAAEKFEKNHSGPVGVKFDAVEKNGLTLTTANIYPSRLSRQYFNISLKDSGVMPVIVKVKNDTGREVTLKYRESVLNTSVIGNRAPMSTYDAMKLIGCYDKLFEACVGSVLFGLSMGFGDMERWSPENDEKEYAIVYHKFDPIVRIGPGEEASGVMLFDLTPPKNDNKVLVKGLTSEGGTLTVVLKSDAGGDIRIQQKIVSKK